MQEFGRQKISSLSVASSTEMMQNISDSSILVACQSQKTQRFDLEKHGYIWILIQIIWACFSLSTRKEKHVNTPLFSLELTSPWVPRTLKLFFPFPPALPKDHGLIEMFKPGQHGEKGGMRTWREGCGKSECLWMSRCVDHNHGFRGKQHHKLTKRSLSISFPVNGRQHVIVERFKVFFPLHVASEGCFCPGKLWQWFSKCWKSIH